MHVLPTVTSHGTSRAALRSAGIAAAVALTLPVLAATSAAAADLTDAEVATAVAQSVPEEPAVDVGPATVLETPDEQEIVVPPAAPAAPSAALIAGVTGPGSLTAGQTAVWTLTVRNAGNGPAAPGLALQPVLPDGVAVVSAAPSDELSCVLGPLVCRVDNGLAADSSAVSVRVELAFSPAMSGTQSVGCAVTPAAADGTAVVVPASMPVTVYDALPEEQPVDTGAEPPAEAAGEAVEEPTVLAAPAAPLTAPVTTASSSRPAAVVAPARRTTAPRLTAVAPRSTGTASAPSAATATSGAPAAAGTPTTLAFTGTRTSGALSAAAAMLALGAVCLRAGRRRPVAVVAR